MPFPPDLLICDPHFHIWDNSVVKNKNLGGIADGPLCTYLASHYCASAAPLPLSSAVHVETVVGQDGSFDIDTVAETRFVLSETAGRDGPFGGKPVGICAFVDLGKPGAAHVIGAHFAAAGARFVGVRMIMNYSATDSTLTWPQVASDAYIGHPPGSPAANEHLPSNLALLGRLGLVFDFHANWFQLAGGAATLAALGDGAPVTVLDHLGCPKLGTGDAREDAVRVAAWKAGMRALAALPRVHVKISGLEYIRKGWMAQGSEARAQVAELVLWVVRTFGAARCMVASNFPVDLHMGGEVRGAAGGAGRKGGRRGVGRLFFFTRRTFLTRARPHNAPLSHAPQGLSALYASLFDLLAPLRAPGESDGVDAMRLLFHDVAERVYGLRRMQALAAGASVMDSPVGDALAVHLQQQRAPSWL
jgi:predicted TIM-barrel fold metal-dependent hydrolase